MDALQKLWKDGADFIERPVRVEHLRPDDPPRAVAVPEMKALIRSAFDIGPAENGSEFRCSAKKARRRAVVMHAQTQLAGQANRKFYVFESESIFRIVQPEAVERSLARGRTAVEPPVIVYAHTRVSDQAVVGIKDPIQQRRVPEVPVRSNS